MSDNSSSVASSDSPVNISSDLLLALSNVSNEMLQCSLHHNRRAALDVVVRSVHNILRAESCAIFLISDSHSDWLKLEASYTDIWETDFQPVEVEIKSAPCSGITGHIAHEGRVVRLCEAELHANPYHAKKPVPFLASNRCYSLIGVPLKDRHGRVIGVFKVDNKKDAQGKVETGEPFNAVDQSIAVMLANQIAVVLENLRVSACLRNLMDEMRNAGTREDLFNIILHSSITLLRAGQGSLCLWDTDRSDLVVAQQQNNENLKVGDALHESALARKAWSSEQDQWVENAADSSDHSTDQRIQSELAVILVCDNRKIGVLSLQSYQPNGLDKHDLELLQILAQYAAIAYLVVDKETRFGHIVQYLAKQMPPRSGVLKSILECVRDIYDFEAGLIYMADFKTRRLNCLAHIGCDNLAIWLKEFFYPFSEPSLSTKVFNEGKTYFCTDVSDDPYVHKGNVHRLGVTGPMVGVPLIFKGKTVGVMVLWNRNRSFPLQTQLRSLDKFANLAAANIVDDAAERQRQRATGAVQDLLIDMQAELAPEKRLHSLLRGVIEAGFDRARIFRYDHEKRCFVVIEAIDRDNMPAINGIQISAESNPYARHTKEHFHHLLGARCYDPASPEAFGEDPDAGLVGKPPGLPWAVVPLVVSGALYGQIVADNLHTQSDITPLSLEYMTLLGALAAHAIANDALINDLRAMNINEQFRNWSLHSLVSPVHTIRNIYEKFIDAGNMEDDDKQQCKKMMSEAVEHLQRLADYARQYSQQNTIAVPVSLREIVEKTPSMVRSQAIEKSITIETELPDSSCICTVLANPGALDTLMQNLVENAVKFSPSGTIIRIRLEDPGNSPNCLRVFVIDEGPGVPHHQRETIFQDLVSIPRNGQPPSSGVGLSVARKIVKDHKGVLGYEDGPNKRGACFWFTLPKVENAGL